MRKWFLASTAILLSSAGCGSPSSAEVVMPTAEEWASGCEAWDDWNKPSPPFKIFANTYYVGTCGIAVILITDPEGHIIIDGGARLGGPLVEANIAALGFDVADVSILLHTHEHFDHVGGLAYLQKKSGAVVLASPPAAPVLRSGEISENDPQAGMHDPFEPMVVGGIVEGGDEVISGQQKLTAIFTPGHTPGALSWRWEACDGDECKTVVYMDSLSPISSDTYRFSNHPEYVAAYRKGLEEIASSPCDLPLTPHPSASQMIQRIESGAGLLSEGGCQSYARYLLDRLERRLADEQVGSE